MTDTVQNRDEKAGWISTLVALVVALVMGAIAVFAAWKSGREAAKLRHERDVEEEKKHQAQLDSQLDSLDVRRTTSTARAAEASARLEELRAQIALVEARRQSALSQIDQITSWESFRTKRGHVTPNPPANPYDNSVDSSTD